MISRRETLAKIGITGGAAAAFLLAPGSSHAADKPKTDKPKNDKPKMAEPKDDKSKPEEAAAPDSKMMAPSGDFDIVSFALTMERLEAAFYEQAVAAHQKRSFLSARAFEVAQKIATAEADHVGALEGVLSGAGLLLPVTANYQFPAQVFVSPVTFAWFAYTLEEIGIGAYLGAVGSIQSDAIREAATSIYGAETQHAAVLRTLAGFDFSPRYYESPLSVEQVTQLIGPYIVA